MRLQLTERDEQYWIAVEDFPLYCKAMDLERYKVMIRLGLPGEERQVTAGDWISSYIMGIDPDPVAAAMRILRRWIRFSGPFTIQNIQKQYAISAKLLKITLKKLIMLGEVVRLQESKKAAAVIYCHSKVYERIRRKTVELARLDIKPKRPETYLSFLCQFQRVNENLEQGEEQLKAVIKQLQGLFLPVEYWEHSVLPSRVKQYDPKLLDSLCSMGVIRWIGRLRQKTKEVAFYPGEDFARIISFGVPDPAITEPERRVYELLKSRPAGFTYEYALELKMDQIEFLHSVEGLVWKGLVTNDLFSPVRYYQEVRKKNLWVKYGSNPKTGRWSVIHWSKSADDREQLQYYVSMLLGRYGILSKEIIQFEKPPVKWTEVYEFLKQSEFFSGVKRGVFLEKISGIQYAKDEVIESLRLHEASLENSGFITIAACDPVNLLPLFQDEEDRVKVTRNPGTAVVFYNGRPVLMVRQYGKIIVPVAEEQEVLVGAIKDFVETFQNRRLWIEHSTISTLYWQEEGQDIDTSPIFEQMRELGFQSSYRGIELFKEFKYYEKQGKSVIR
ncbi:MAG TPA: hypothetical protein PKA28_16665 [Methylomusa anaerophila]|nr:hypothetical protein [Methylomusa anaerophila]